eukprot:7565022-Ditylum_brightwellii.AAC.1
MISHYTDGLFSNLLRRSGKKGIRASRSGGSQEIDVDTLISTAVPTHLKLLLKLGFKMHQGWVVIRNSEIVN